MAVIACLADRGIQPLAPRRRVPPRAKIRGGKYWLWRAVDNGGEVLDFLVQRRRDAQAAKKLVVKLLKKHGFAPSRVVTDRQRSARSGSRLSTIGACEQTTGRRTRISRYDAENENCRGSNHPAQSNVSSPSMPPHSTHSPINGLSPPAVAAPGVAGGA